MFNVFEEKFDKKLDEKFATLDPHIHFHSAELSCCIDQRFAAMDEKN